MCTGCANIGNIILLDYNNENAHWMPARSGESVSHPGINFYMQVVIFHTDVATC